MLQDDLLVRAGAGYQTTSKGERLLRELSAIVPRLDRVLAGAEFDPAIEEASFGVAGMDSAMTLLGPPLCQWIEPWLPNVTVTASPWAEGRCQRSRTRTDRSVAECG